MYVSGVNKDILISQIWRKNKVWEENEIWESKIITVSGRYRKIWVKTIDRESLL